MGVSREISVGGLSGWLISPEDEPFDNRPLSQILEEAFSKFQEELKFNGSSHEFIELRRKLSRQIKVWWAIRKSFVPRTGTVRVGEEEVSVEQMGVYENDDEEFLHITSKTPLEEWELSVTADKSVGLDLFLHPPKITGKCLVEPDGEEKVRWELVFRSSAVSTITKITLHDHPKYQLPYVKEIHTIDASIFGIDTTDIR